MEISLLTLLIGLALGTFALGFIFARLAKLSKLSSPARQFAHEGATASTPATPEPAEVLTTTQLHYQQTHINSLNTTVRMLEEKLRWAEQDRQEAEEAAVDLHRQLKAAKEPRGDEVTQREAELALLRAQLNAAISNASKLERKAIRAEHDAVAAKEENQQLRAKLWAQQNTDMALSRLQDRQTALQNAINENQVTRDRLAGEVVALNAALAEREALLADRESMLRFAERRLKEKEEDYARLVAHENAWEKQATLLADTQAQAAQAERERDEAQRETVQLHVALDDAGAQMQAISERLHALHEAMALRDGQVTELHGELRRLQQENAGAYEIIADLNENLAHANAAAEAASIAHEETLAMVKTAGESTANDLREALARTVAAAEETRTMLRLRDSAVTMLQDKLELAEQQHERLEMALLLATANIESLREQGNDIEAARMLLEVELENKAQALAIAQEDLAQLSSREYELTVALERSSREHQSSFETVLLHVNKVEEELVKAQAELAQKIDEANTLAAQMREIEIASRLASQQIVERESALATLQAELQAKAAALVAGEAALTAAQVRAGELENEISALQLSQNTLDTHLHAKVAVLATAEAVIGSMREQMAERDQQLADLRILANERGRELETARAQIAYLTDGLDDLNNTANEKFAALQAAQTALNAAQTANEIAQTQIAQLTTERDALEGELAGARQQIEEQAGETAALHAELTTVLTSAAGLQIELDEARAQIAQMQVVNAALSETVETQAGEIITLAMVNDQLEGTLTLAEKRIADLALALENTGNRQTDMEAKLEASEAALDTLQREHTMLLTAKAAADAALESLTNEIAALTNAKDGLSRNLLFTQSRVEGLIRELRSAAARRADLEATLLERTIALDTLQEVNRQHESTISQDETRIAQLTDQLEHTAGARLALEMAVQESASRLELANASLIELRQAHAALLQEFDTLRRTSDALELQTHNQMKTLVELSDASAVMQQQLQERESSLLAAQVALAQAQQTLAAKPEPGTLEAQLIDTTLTLQRLEKDFVALQAEKDAIEDEYTRAQIAGQMRMTEKEHALRVCGAQVDALALEIALLKAKES